ncbi:gliding motility-associated C-terminal domain-containing protein [Larkinella soli]|uniref:gliding motility-associated C-terminal domain-containing protein n=1 Tax=Larkinella soli TaxID=1770527 RepID=UPI000FFCA591|nr:gliding motility-associated C-terminal domain-containing protein [Larkinella soli]
MRVFRLLFLLLFLPGAVFGQNLVPNPGFEQKKALACSFISRPDNLSNYLTDWYAPTGGTSDVWSSDPGLSTTCSQYLSPTALPVHDGNQCIGLYTYVTGSSSFSYREYAQVRLKQPLVKGKAYRAEMWVLLFDYTPPNPSEGVTSNTATNNLGMHFSKDSLVLREVAFRFGSVLNYKPQVNQTQVLQERLKWVPVSGCFIADEAYEYLTVGNFFEDAQTQAASFATAPRNRLAYYLIDDVSVEPVTAGPPAVRLGADTTLCAPQTLALALTDTAGTTYRWQDGSTQARYTVRQSGIYWVTATRGRCIAYDSIQVRVEPRVSLPPDTLLCKGEQLTLSVSHPIGRYAWNTGSTEARITVAEAGTYAVRVPSDFCALTDTVRIAFADCPGQVPNVFTPNGDGKNDTFFIPNIDLLPWRLEIYNRWGRLIYKADAYANDWAGQNQPAGLYYYLLRSRELNRDLKGWVELLR